MSCTLFDHHASNIWLGEIKYFFGKLIECGVVFLNLGRIGMKKAKEKLALNNDWHLKMEANKQMDIKVWNKSFADNDDNQMPPCVLVFYCSANEAIFDMRNIVFFTVKEGLDALYRRLTKYLVVKVLFFRYLVNSENIFWKTNWKGNI